MTSTKFYRIENIASGHVFGTWEAEDEDEARASFERESDAGPSREIRVREIKPLFSNAALAFIEETGADWRSDLRALLAGKGRDAFRAEQLAGADEDRVEGIEDYVDAVRDVASVG